MNVQIKTSSDDIFYILPLRGFGTSWSQKQDVFFVLIYVCSL